MVRQLMSNAIADWYLHTETPQDHSKLSRVLDVMQDLKALFTLLNNTQFSFVIDLACLAAKREYLKLDTWIMDRIREHQVGVLGAHQVGVLGTPGGCVGNTRWVGVLGTPGGWVHTSVCACVCVYVYVLLLQVITNLPT